VEDNIEEDGTCPNQVSIEIDLSWADPEFPDKVAFWIADGYFDSDDDSSVSNALPPHKSLQVEHAQPHRVGVGDMGTSTLDNFRSSQGDEKYRISMEFCKSLNIRIADDENTKLLFSFLRTIVCNLDEIAFLNRMNITCDDILKPISLRNELTAMKLLKEIIVDHLARYPTTIQDDIEDLMDKQAYPPNGNRRNAKIQVKGEKEVLCHFLLWAQSSILVLEAIQCDRKNSCLNEFNLACHENFSAAMEELYEAEVHWTILNHCKNVLNDLL
jgi:Rubisco LSMT substrate-binding